MRIFTEDSRATNVAMCRNSLSRVGVVLVSSQIGPESESSNQTEFPVIATISSYSVWLTPGPSTFTPWMSSVRAR